MLVSLVSQRYGIQPTEYLATRGRQALLSDVAAWQATFLAPMHTVAKAFGGGDDKAPDREGLPPEQAAKVRGRLPSWHRKARGAGGRKQIMWDLDNDQRAETALFGAVPTDQGAGVRSVGVLKPGNPLFHAISG